jgi:ribosomal protein S18 acetylase RimI-like enzyme
MLRAAIPEDSNAVATVLMRSRQTFLPYAPSPHSPQDVLAWVTQQLIPSGGVTVALDDGEVVGVFAVSEDHQTAWVDQLYILPGFESKGFGSRLLAVAHESLKRPIRLFTYQQNSGALRFYARHGYTVVALSDGQNNEEKCPDALLEFNTETEA